MRTFWAALVALVTSVINIAVLTILNGQELGWVCLGSCTADVTINALALFFVTGSYGDPQKPIDTVPTPVPILQTSSIHPPGNFSCPFIRCQEPLLTTKWNPGASHLSVHFPDTQQHGRSTTFYSEMAVKSDIANSSGTATSNFITTVGSVEDEKPRYHANDSYINPGGMITSEGAIGMSIENSFYSSQTKFGFQWPRNSKFEGNCVSISPMWPLMKHQNAQRPMGKTPRFTSCL